MSHPIQNRRPSLGRSCLAGLAAAALVLVAGAAAGEPRGGPGGGGHRRMAALVEELGLDDATQAAVGAVLDEAHEERRKMRPRLHSAHERMRELMEAAEPDEAAIFEQVDRLSDLEREVKKSRIRTLLRVQKLLPPEARAELLERMKRDPRRHGRRGGHERHGEPMDGPGGPEHREGPRRHREGR